LSLERNLNALLHAYCEDHTTPPSEILYRLEQETHLKTLAPQMLSGRLQGQLLRWISLLMKPERMLEVGTFTGYGAICLAEGLTENGILHTIEGNPELEYLIRKYVREAELEEKIRLHIGDALEIIPKLEEAFDLIYLDANKRDYERYYDLCLPKLKTGGLIIADNVLWGGKVVDTQKDDPDTRVMRAFNDRLRNDERVDTLMLPVRDGILVARRISRSVDFEN